MKALSETGLEYSDVGSGEPVFLVHAGGFADWFVPLTASPALAGYRIIRVRRAGYGFTPPNGALTLADHAAHLIELAEFLGFSKIHVVGHSSGALIALELAVARPSVVQSLVLIEPAACGPFQVPAFAEIGQRYVGPAMASFGAGNLSAAFDYFMHGVCGANYREVFNAVLGKSGFEQAVLQSSYFFRDEVPAAMQWQFSAADAEKVRSPILIVEGAAGRLEGHISRQVTEAATVLFPLSEVALIEGANHMAPLQKPDELAVVLAEFLNRHKINDRLKSSVMAVKS